MNTDHLVIFFLKTGSHCVCSLGWPGFKGMLPPPCGKFCLCKNPRLKEKDNEIKRIEVKLKDTESDVSKMSELLKVSDY